MPLTRADRAKILQSIKKLVPERHINVINLNQDYKQWVTLVDQKTPDLINTEEVNLFEKGVSELLAALGSSHTAFYHSRGSGVPAPHAISATLQSVQTPAGNQWMFLDVVEDGAAARAGIQPGELLFSVDSKLLLPPVQPKFSIGGQHRLQVGKAAGESREVLIEVPNRAAKDRPPMIEPRSISHRMLNGNIGLVKVASFPGSVGQTFAKRLAGVVEELKLGGADRLIVDIRGNVGGGLGSLRLMSYFCPGKLEVGHSLTRRRLQSGYQKEKLTRIGRIPASKAELLMMALRFRVIQKDRSMVLVTEGLGPQPFHGRIVILVNEHSHSAAEMVASFAKENHLATLVGVRTGGQVLGGASFKLVSGYQLRMPVAGWYTWKGECIEGKGVEPDVPVGISPESLARGVDDQLNAAISAVQSLK